MFNWVLFFGDLWYIYKDTPMIPLSANSTCSKMRTLQMDNIFCVKKQQCPSVILLLEMSTTNTANKTQRKMLSCFCSIDISIQLIVQLIFYNNANLNTNCLWLKHEENKFQFQQVKSLHNTSRLDFIKLFVTAILIQLDFHEQHSIFPGSCCAGM